MAMQELKIETLAELDDGRVAKAFLRELKRAVEDCDDRPALKGARSVSLVCKLVPLISADGSLENVAMEFDFDCSLPKRVTRRYTLDARKGGILVFSTNSPDVRQKTIDDNE